MQRRFDLNVRLLELDAADVRADLAELRVAGIERFVVDIGFGLIGSFFDQAMKAGLVHSASGFLIADLDFASADLFDVTETGAHVFGLSLINEKTIQHLIDNEKLTEDLADILRKSRDAALLFDSVRLFELAVARVSNTTDLTNPDVKCDDRDAPYEFGRRLLTAVEQVSNRTKPVRPSSF